MARLSPFKKNPRYFQDPAGHPAFFCGISATPLLLRADLDDHALFSRLARSDVNLVHLSLDAADRDPDPFISPYKRSKGAGRTAAGFRRFDLTAPNPAYWERIAALLKHARQHGLFTLLSLFHGPSFSPASPEGWAASAWNPENNVNGEALGPEFHSGDPRQVSAALFPSTAGEPETPAETFVAERQREMLEAALELDEETPGVIYHLGGSGAPAGWTAHWAEFLEGETLSPFVLNAEYIGQGLPAAGYVSHSGFDGPDNPLPDMGRKALFLLGSTPESPRELRQTAWQGFLQGGQNLYAPEGEIRDEHLRSVSVIRRFLRERRVRYWTMRPETSLDGAAVLSRTDDRYLAYLPHGGAIRLNLSEGTGSFTVTWWHAAEEYLITSGATLAGREREFTAPDEGEWVLDLHKKIR